jgi:kumamolisin
MSDDRVALAGSAPRQVAEDNLVPADPNATLTVTIYLRRRPGADPHTPMTRDEAQYALSASPDDMATVKRFVQSYGLEIVEENDRARSLQVRGTVAQMKHAFDVRLLREGTSLTYVGEIHIPAELKDVIVAVLGLDQRPAARRA